MSTGNEDQQWMSEVPERVPYFDPAGMYRVELKIRFLQTGRTEGEGDQKKFVPFATPIETYNGDANYETLPVDGVQIVAIAMLKAQQDIQAGGMIVRTPIESEAKYEEMIRMLNRPSFTEEQLAEIKKRLS